MSVTGLIQAPYAFLVGFGPRTATAIAQALAKPPLNPTAFWDMDNGFFSQPVGSLPPMTDALTEWCVFPSAAHRAYLSKRTHKGTFHSPWDFASGCRILQRHYFGLRLLHWKHSNRFPPGAEVRADTCRYLVYNCAPRPRSEEHIGVYAAKVDVMHASLVRALETFCGAGEGGVRVPELLLVTAREEEWMVKGGFRKPTGPVERWALGGRLRMGFRAQVECAMERKGREAVDAVGLAEVMAECEGKE